MRVSGQILFLLHLTGFSMAYPFQLNDNLAKTTSEVDGQLQSKLEFHGNADIKGAEDYLSAAPSRDYQSSAVTFDLGFANGSVLSQVEDGTTVPTTDIFTELDGSSADNIRDENKVTGNGGSAVVVLKILTAVFVIAAFMWFVFLVLCFQVYTRCSDTISQRRRARRMRLQRAQSAVNQYELMTYQHLLFPGNENVDSNI